MPPCALLCSRPPRRRKPGTPHVVSVLLNTQPEETLSDDDRRLFAGLPYFDDNDNTEGAGRAATLKLADFILYSERKDKLNLDLSSRGGARAPAVQQDGGPGV